MAQQLTRLKVVIVEDEEDALARLRRMLQAHTDAIVVVGEARNGPEAVEIINDTNPDLIFLDMALPGFDGFEVLDQLTRKPKVVITTASHDYTVKALQYGAIDYLLKPIFPEDVERSILSASEPPSDKEERLPSARGRWDPLVIRGVGRFIVPAEVVLLERVPEGTDVHTMSGVYTTPIALAELEQRLGREFQRVRRGTFINVDFVSSLVHTIDGLVVVTEDGTSTRVTYRHAQSLREALERRGARAQRPLRLFFDANSVTARQAVAAIGVLQELFGDELHIVGTSTLPPLGPSTITRKTAGAA